MRTLVRIVVVATLAVAGCSSDASDGGASSGGSTSSSSGGSSSTSSSSSSSGSSSDDAAQACVDAINQFRAKNSLPPYERWADAEACADRQAAADAKSGKGHGSFGQCQELAQTECPGWPGPPASMIGNCLQAMYDQGPGEGHHDTIVDKKYKRVACGFGTAPNGKIWSVQNYQ